MTAQLRDGLWTASPSTTRKHQRIIGVCTLALAWSGAAIGLLILAAALYPPAGLLLERLLVP